ncbi:MAG TPA: contact-dependent growth inhibition system immunity protein [Candidatus Didemnitutus sp.]|nr:contact-dependent growth inhibition system immunity protein [Candidatus Didemnitutus sp.]
MSQTLAQILGPWQQPEVDTSLITRCRNAWNKPIDQFTDLELVTCLQQDLAIGYVLPIAKNRLQNSAPDNSEMFEGQLAEAVADAEKRKTNQPPQPTPSGRG